MPVDGDGADIAIGKADVRGVMPEAMTQHGRWWQGLMSSGDPAQANACVIQASADAVPAPAIVRGSTPPGLRDCRADLAGATSPATRPRQALCRAGSPTRSRPVATGWAAPVFRRGGLLGKAWRRIRQLTWPNCRNSEPVL